MGLIPGLLGGSGMGLTWRSFIGAYDAIPSIAAAYGMRRLLASYTGSLIRLRRSSDNAESDFGYRAGGHLDTAAISTWVGGGSGYVVTWYDQSGNGYNATQGTAGSQPLYVASGQNSRPVARFDGTDDKLSLASNPATGASAGSLLVASIADNDPAAADQSGAVVSGFGSSGQLNHAPFTNSTIYFGFGSTTRHSFSRTAGLLASPYIMAVRSAASDWEAHINGASRYSTGTNTVGWGASPTIGWSSAGYRYDGDIYEVIVASAAWSSSNRAAAESAANAYWSIY